MAGNWNWGDIATTAIGAAAQYYNNQALQDAQQDQWNQQAQLTKDTAGRRGWEIMDPIFAGLAGQLLPTYQQSMNQLGRMPQWGQGGGGGGKRVQGSSQGMNDILAAAQDYATGFTDSPLYQSGVGAIQGRLNGQTGNPMMDAAFGQAQQFANSGDPTGTQMASANPYINPAFNFFQQFAQSRDNPGGLQDYIDRQKTQTTNGLGFQGPQNMSFSARSSGGTGAGSGGSANSGPSFNVGGRDAAAHASRQARQIGPPETTGGGRGGAGGPRGPMPPSPDGYAQTGPTGAAGMIREQYNKELSDYMDESNPFLSNVIADVSDDLQSQHARNLALTDASAEGAGRYGSSAFNLERAAQAADLLKRQGATSNQLRFQDYNNQLGRFDAGRQNAMGLGTQMDMNQLDNDTRARIAAEQAAASRAASAASAGAARYGSELQHDLGLRGLELEALGLQQGGALSGGQGMAGLAGLFGDLQGQGAQLGNQMALGGLGAMQGLAGLFQGSQDAALGMIPGMGMLPMGLYEGAFGMAQGANAADQAAQRANQAAAMQRYQNQMKQWQMQTQLPWDFLGNAVNIGNQIGGHITMPTGMG